MKTQKQPTKFINVFHLNGVVLKSEQPNDAGWTAYTSTLETWHYGTRLFWELSCLKFDHKENTLELQFTIDYKRTAFDEVQKAFSGYLKEQEQNR